jgi:ubiquitin-conjugating enzyme E2 variant
VVVGRAQSVRAALFSAACLLPPSPSHPPPFPPCSPPRSAPRVPPPLCACPARNFKLLDELEEAEKGSKAAADISLGLARADDMTMSDWQASIFAAAGGAGEVRMWTLKLHCCASYPKVAPTVAFTSKIVMDGVDAKGAIAAAKVPYLASWSPSKTMHGLLTEIKGLIGKASRSQPPEGANY